jgi:hypothetical protein
VARLTSAELRHMAERLQRIALETSDSVTRMRLHICAKELQSGAAELEMDKPPSDCSAITSKAAAPARGRRKRLMAIGHAAAAPGEREAPVPQPTLGWLAP